MKRIVIAMLLLALVAWASPSWSQSAPKKYLSAATTNSTLVSNRRSILKVLLPINTTTALYYLKFYNKATAPTCGADVPVWTVPIPYGATNSGGGVALPSSDGLLFATGLGFCLTGGIADSDTSSAATGVVINLGVTN